MPKDQHVIFQVVHPDGQVQEYARYPKHALTEVVQELTPALVEFEGKEVPADSQGNPLDSEGSNGVAAGDLVISVYPGGQAEESPEAEEGAEGEAEGPEYYEDDTVEGLKDELRDRELPVSGNKAELVERLAESDESEAPEAEGDGALDES
jgi:hypothetical protein